MPATAIWQNEGTVLLNNNNNENFIEFFYALTIENLTVQGNLQLAT
jgi:hypothetical protein